MDRLENATIQEAKQTDEFLLLFPVQRTRAAPPLLGEARWKVNRDTFECLIRSRGTNIDKAKNKTAEEEVRARRSPKGR